MIGYLEDKERCGDKNCYSKKEAITALNHSFKKRGAILRIYYCEDCGYWHLTHKGVLKDIYDGSEEEESSS
jgi:hypothetical protein